MEVAWQLAFEFCLADSRPEALLVEQRHNPAVAVAPERVMTSLMKWVMPVNVTPAAPSHVPSKMQRAVHVIPVLAAADQEPEGGVVVGGAASGAP